MEDLQVDHDLCKPYDPRGKPDVARAIKTFQHGLSICPGFIGHSVADRKKIETRKAFSERSGADEGDVFEVGMDLAEVQVWRYEGSDLIFHPRDHGGLKTPAKTPFLTAASWSGELRQIEDRDALSGADRADPGQYRDPQDHQARHPHRP